MSKQDIYNRVLEIIQDRCWNVDPDDITLDTRIDSALADAVTLTEIRMDILNEFGVDIHENEIIDSTVQEVADKVSNRL